MSGVIRKSFGPSTFRTAQSAKRSGGLASRVLCSACPEDVGFASLRKGPAVDNVAIHDLIRKKDFYRITLDVIYVHVNGVTFSSRLWRFTETLNIRAAALISLQVASCRKSKWDGRT